MTELLPFALDLHGRRCLCVGGGGVAARRVPLLLDAGARVLVVAPHLDPVLAALVGRDGLSYLARGYQEGEATGYALVLAATGVEAVDARVAEDGLAGNGLVCVAGEPALGNCQFMATVRRGPLVVGLQTGGAAPAVSAALRLRIEAVLPERVGEVVEQVGALRAALRRAVADPRERARRWAAVVEAGLIEEALGPDGEQAVARMRVMLEGAS